MAEGQATTQNPEEKSLGSKRHYGTGNARAGLRNDDEGKLYRKQLLCQRDPGTRWYRLNSQNRAELQTLTLLFVKPLLDKREALMGINT